MGEWISVNVNLPEMHNVKNDYESFEESAPVLVFCRSGRITTAQCGIFEGKRYWSGYDMLTENVTHWMPLPEPPKK